MVQTVHLIVQYLAAASIRFITPREDDSHTNLIFNPELNSLETQALNANGDVLRFSYEHFALQWNNDPFYSIQNVSHFTILNWLEQQVAIRDFNTHFTYTFHYDLPYSVEANTQFLIDNESQLMQMAQWRTLADSSLRAVAKTHHLHEEPRIWPHHFDTGLFAPLTETLSIGIGLAIPDTISTHYYFYASVYKNNSAILPKKFKKLPVGEWKQSAFKGAIFPIKSTTKKEDVIRFYNSVITAYL